MFRTILSAQKKIHPKFFSPFSQLAVSEARLDTMLPSILVFQFFPSIICHPLENISDRLNMNAPERSLGRTVDYATNPVLANAVLLSPACPPRICKPKFIKEK